MFAYASAHLADSRRTVNVLCCVAQAHATADKRIDFKNHPFARLCFSHGQRDALASSTCGISWLSCRPPDFNAPVESDVKALAGPRSCQVSWPDRERCFDANPTDLLHSPHSSLSYLQDQGDFPKFRVLSYISKSFGCPQVTASAQARGKIRRI